LDQQLGYKPIINYDTARRAGKGMRVIAVDIVIIAVDVIVIAVGVIVIIAVEVIYCC
jgi:hypothetical protein